MKKITNANDSVHALGSSGRVGTLPTSSRKARQTCKSFATDERKCETNGNGSEWETTRCDEKTLGGDGMRSSDSSLSRANSRKQISMIGRSIHQNSYQKSPPRAPTPADDTVLHAPSSHSLLFNVLLFIAQLFLVTQTDRSNSFSSLVIFKLFSLLLFTEPLLVRNQLFVNIIARCVTPVKA